MSQEAGAKKEDGQLMLARSSWMATLIAIGGNFATGPMVQGAREPIVGFVVSAFWTLFILYGIAIGLYAIVRGCSREHRRCLKHGIIGAALNIFLSVSAIVAFQQYREMARRSAASGSPPTQERAR